VPRGSCGSSPQREVRAALLLSVLFVLNALAWGYYLAGGRL
jgi:hypothetical protein